MVIPTNEVAQVVQAATIAAFGREHWESMDYIIKNESNYNIEATNPSSGACGLPQSLPCSKLLAKCPDLKDIDCQTKWMIGYIRDRYHDPINAADFKRAHGWY